MGTFLLFLLILLLVIFLMVLNLAGGILRGILGFFGIGSRKHKHSSSKKNYSEEAAKPNQSVEGAKRMRKFKNAAEDADYEVVND